jgi:HEAT repeat protein
MRARAWLSIVGLAVLACSKAPRGGSEPRAASATPTRLTADSSAAPPLADARVATLAALEPESRGFKPGTRYDYELAFSTKVEMGQGATTYDYDLAGQLQVEAVRKDDRELTLRLRASNLKLENRVASTRHELELALAELSRKPCYATFSGGRLSAFRFPKGLSGMAAGTCRELASALQVAHSKVKAVAYASIEADVMGEYEVSYRAGSSPSHWTKTKQRYLAIATTGSAAFALGERLTADVVSAKADVELDADGRPRKIEGQQRLRVGGLELPIASTQKLSLSATRQSPFSVTPSMLEELASYTQVGAGEAYAAEIDTSALDSVRISGLALDDILAQLEQRAQAPKAPGVNDPTATDEQRVKLERELDLDSRLFAALTSTLRQTPKAIERTVGRIRGGSPAQDVFVDALGMTGTERAQRALIGLIRDKNLDERVKDRALFSLSRSEAPSEVAIEALKARAVEHQRSSKQALYGLGTYFRHLRDAGKLAEARAVGTFLVDRLARAQSSSELVTALRALSNAGDDAALERIAPHLEHGEWLVRASAVRALKLMRSEGVEPIIAKVIANDESADVRVAAIQAAELRKPSQALVEALGSASRASDPHVRFQAVELVIRWLPSEPSLRAALQAVAQSDAEPKVRERARSALAERG